MFSIDIAIAAVSGYYAVNKAFHVQADSRYSLLLFLAVLLVYWLDHILDIFKYGKSISIRHRIFAQNLKSIYAIGSIFILAIVCFSIPLLITKSLLYAASIGLLCMVYLFFNQTKYLNKEMVAASIYSAGVYFQLLIIPNLYFIPAFLLFWGITYYAMMGIAKTEFKNDLNFGIPNNYQLNRFLKPYYWLLFIGSVLLLFFTYNTALFSLTFSYVLMLISLKLLFYALPEQKFLNENYRMAVEWLFVIPWIFT